MMTPSALTIQWVTLFAVAALCVIVRRGLASYGTEKGKNLATKEDIAEITRLIESVRTAYAADLERLKSTLAADAAVQRAQYDAERKTYETVWFTLATLQDSVGGLRNVAHYAVAERPEERARADELIADFMTAFRAYRAVVQAHRPFYPEGVYRELRALLARVTAEVGVGLRMPPFPDKYSVGSEIDDAQYLSAVVGSSDAISNQVNHICDVIRERLARVAVATSAIDT